jgi:hypothetical protein
MVPSWPASALARSSTPCSPASPPAPCEIASSRSSRRSSSPPMVLCGAVSACLQGHGGRGDQGPSLRADRNRRLPYGCAGGHARRARSLLARPHADGVTCLCSRADGSQRTRHRVLHERDDGQAKRHRPRCHGVRRQQLRLHEVPHGPCSRRPPIMRSGLSRVDVLPKTPSDKIMRRLLKEIMATGEVGSDSDGARRCWVRREAEGAREGGHDVTPRTKINLARPSSSPTLPS